VDAHEAERAVTASSVSENPGMTRRHDGRFGQVDLTADFQHDLTQSPSLHRNFLFRFSGRPEHQAKFIYIWIEIQESFALCTIIHFFRREFPLRKNKLVMSLFFFLCEIPAPLFFEASNDKSIWQSKTHNPMHQPLASRNRCPYSQQTTDCGSGSTPLLRQPLEPGPDHFFG